MTRLWAEILIVATAHLWVAWILTVLMHAACLSAAVAILTREPRFAPADAVALWRTALLAPLATATVPALFGVHTPASVALFPVVPGGIPLWMGSLVLLVPLAALPVLALWRRWAQRRSIARLFGQRVSGDDRLAAEVRDAARQFRLAAPRVTVSGRCMAPAVIGSGELCLPARFASLPPGHRRALLAHEMAHLARRDPQWHRASHMAARLLPFGRRVTRALRNASERAADERAVDVTGDPMALAEALTNLAADLVTAPHVASAADAPVVDRVAALLDRRGARPRLLARSTLIVALMAATTALAPSLRLTPDDAANRIVWLRPGPTEPDARLLYVRFTIRRLTRALHLTH